MTRTVGAAEGWSAEPGGAALAGEWRAEKSIESKGAVAVKAGTLVITGEEARYHHVERYLGIDGTDEAPLRVECSIASERVGGHLATCVGLWWGRDSFIGLGPAYVDWERQGARAWWIVDGVPGESGIHPRLGKWETWARYRIIVTSRDVSAFASADGLRFTRIATFERGQGRFEGAPELVIVGRGSLGPHGTRAADLDNDAGNLWNKDLKTFSFTPVSIESEAPVSPTGPPPGYEKLDDWEKTFEAWRGLGVPKEWWLLGPLEYRREPYGPETRVDLGKRFELQAGVDYYVQLPRAPALENVQEGDYTLAAWVKPRIVPSGKRVHERKFAVITKEGRDTGLYFNNEGRFELAQLTNRAPHVLATSSRAFDPGEWRHVAGVVSWSERQVRLYVDGKLEGTAAIPQGRKCHEFKSAPWRIGVGGPRQGDLQYALDGEVDDVRIYSSALAGEEVSDLHGGGGAPRIELALADDPDDGDAELGPGDTLTIIFDVATNTPPARRRGQIDALIDFGGKPPGARYRGEWRDERTLVVTVERGHAGGLAPGDRIVVRSDGGAKLKNLAGTSAASRSAATVGGDWGDPRPEGILGWWKLDEYEGPKAMDSSGNGLHGSIAHEGRHGSHAWRPGKGRKGGALALAYWDDPGSNRTEGHYVKIPDSPKLSPTRALTVSAWVNAERWGDHGHYWPGIVRKDGQYSLESHEVEKLRFYVWLGRSQKFVDCKAPSAGKWHHLAGVYDGRRIRIYVDGALAGERSVSGAVAATSNPVHIGTRIENESKFFDGSLDDVRIYGRALAAEEIAKLHALDSPRSRLVGYWRFDGEKGDAAVDSSGNDSHGKIVGGERVKGRLGGALSFRVRDARWKRHEVPADKRSPAVRLGSLLKSAGPKSIGYAYTRIISAEGGPERFYFDGERAVELYVNGALAGSCESRKVPLIPDRVAAKVDLAKGLNHVVLKVTRERGDWRFVFRHEPDAATGRIAVLRQLVADFPEEPERSARALFEVAAIREKAGLLRKAAYVLAETRDIEGAPASVVHEAALERARLLGMLRDYAAASAELRGVIASLPAGSAERFELSLELLRSLVRAGDDERAAGLASELGTGGPERAARAHCVLAAAYEERGDAAKRIAALGAARRKGGKATAADDSLLVERAEAILVPYRKEFAEHGLPDSPEVRTALRHYREAVALLPTRGHELVAPVTRKAEAAMAKGRIDSALGLFTAAYFRAWMVRDGLGEQLVRLADEADIRMLPPAEQAGGNPREFWTVLNGARVQVADADQVKDWWAVGGFDNKDWKAYGNPYVGPGKVDVTKPVRGRKWRRLGPEAYERGFLDLGELEQGEHIVAYLYTELDYDAALKTELRMGGDDGFTVWLNGRKVHEDRTQRSVVPDEVVVGVDLKAGTNTILVRVQNGTGPWGFMMRVTTKPVKAKDFACFLHMIEHYPEHRMHLAPAFHSIAYSYVERKQPEASLAMLRAVARAFPDSPTTVAGASAQAVDQALSGDASVAFAAEVAAWAEKALERRGSPRAGEALRNARIRGARALKVAGDVAGAADRLRAVVRSDPASEAAGAALMDLAEIQRDAGMRSAAAASYDAALATRMSDDALRVRAHRGRSELRRTGGETVTFEAPFEVATLIRTGERAADRDDLERALRCYQQAASGFGGALFRLSDAKLVGVAEYCADRVRALGGKGRAVYRRLFDRRAASLLRRADEAGDAARLVDVIRTYGMTSSGDDALSRFGNLELERGRPASAASAFSRVIEEHPDSDLDRAVLLAKLAFALRSAGEKDAARDALDRLGREFEGKTITISGEKKPVARYVAEARGRLEALRDAGTRDGAGRRTGFAPFSPKPVACRVEVRFPEGATGALARRRLWPSLHRHVTPHAAVDGGRAFFGTLDETFAVDTVSGRLAWRSGAGFAELRASRGEVVFGGMPETAPAVKGGVLYSRARAGRGYAIEARDARTGELRWSTESLEELGGLAAVTSPCASDGRAFALFRGTGESQVVSAACLDAESGEVLWRTPIVSGIAEVELERDERLSVADHAAAPAAAGGDVYFATDLGAVAALDATTGAVRWIARYPRARFDIGRGKRERRLLAARTPGRVLVDENALYVCSRDALAVICVRRRDGEVVWSRDLADCRMITGLVPATADGPARLVIQGGAIECLDASSGTRLWRWKPPRGEGALFGSGALGGEFVYAPTEGGLHRLRVADGRTVDSSSWKDLALGGPVGNLTVLRDSVLGFGGGRFVRIGSRKGELVRTAVPGCAVRDGALASALPRDAAFAPPLVALSRVGPSGVAIHRPPDAAEDECYFQFDDGLARVDAGVGRTLWRTRFVENPTRLAWSSSLIVAVHEKHLVALDRARGGVVWTHALTPDASGVGFDSGDSRGFDEVAVGKRYVAARQKDSSKVHVIDAATGRRVTLLEVKGVRGMVVEGGVLVTGISADRKFAAVGWEPVTGGELWREVMPVEPHGHWGITSSGRADLFFFGGDRIVRFDAATRGIGKAIGCRVRDPVAEVRAGRITLTGKTKSIILDARTGERLFEGTPRGGNRQKRGRPYRYAGDRAIHAWTEGGRFHIECRSVAGGKVLWKSETRSSCWPVDAMAVGTGWLEICARDRGGDSKRRPGPGLSYRLYDVATGRLLDEGDLPGTPTGVGGRQAAVVGKRVFYVAREGIYTLGGAGGSIESAVASVRNASARMDGIEREAAAEFIATYEPDVRRAFVPSEPIRVDGRLDDWAGIRPITIAEAVAVRSVGGAEWAGPEDLSARARVAWDAKRVCVSVDATDDVHAPAAPGADLLTGDCLVVAFEAGAARDGKRDADDEGVVSFALAFERGRPVMRRLSGRQSGAAGVSAGMQCEFHAVRRAGGVVYELAVPWPLLRPSPDERPGKKLEMGLAVALVDRDGARPDTAIEWGTGLVRGLRADAFGRIRFIDITPRRIAQYREFMARMPSHELSLKFLASIGEAQDGRADVGVRIAELERFLKLRPGRVNAVTALGELARRYRQAGNEDSLASAVGFARKRRVDAKAVVDVAGPASGTRDEGRFIRQRVYLDPAAPPKEIAVRFKSREGEWSHGAYWGAAAAGASASVSSKKWPAGALPPEGRWTDLVIPVGVVGLEAHEVRSVGFAATGGRALWGRTEYHHDGKVTVVVDGKFPQGGRFRGEAKPRWVDAPGGGGARAHTCDPDPRPVAYEIECGRGTFKTRLPKPREDDAARDARRRMYLEAAPLIPENAEALELLKDAEELYRGLKSEERREAVARIYEDFLRAALDTPLAYTVLDRLHSVYGREKPGSMERCEAIMDEVGIGREQRRVFYRSRAPTIRSWKVLGWFDPGAGKQNLEKVLRAERFPVRLSASYPDSAGGMATWRDAESSWHSLDLWDHLPSRQRGYPVAYAYTRVEVPRARKACLVLGIGHGGVVWVNGKRTGPAIWDGFRRDRHYVPIQLKEGLNDILAKITHSSGRGQISCRLADQNGRPLDGVTVSLPVNVVSAVGSAEPESVRVVFSEPVERASAETAANYSVSGDATITGASLGSDWRTVTLWMSPLARGTAYTLTVGGVRSAASALRGVEPGSTKEFVVLGSGGGLTGTYFSELEFKGKSFKRVDETVDFAWGEKSPKGVEPGDYSVRWTGFVEPLHSEEYTFVTASDDGVRLWVNGRKLVDNWTSHGVVEDTGKVRLEASEKYEIKLEYFQGWGDSCIRLYWSSRSQEREVIPRTQLYPEAPLEGGPAGVPAEGGTQPADLGAYPGKLPAGTSAQEAWRRVLALKEASPLPDGAVDLLGPVVPARDAVRGKWRRVGGQLVSPMEPNARVQLKEAPRGSYRLEVQFTRIRGDCMAVMFPVHDTSGLLVVSGWQGKVSGLAFVDGRDANGNKTTRDGKLSDGEKHTVLLEVRVQRNGRARVAVSLDGKAYLTWRGAASSLAPDRAWGLRAPGSVGLGAYNASIVFHGCRLQTLGAAGAR